MHAVVIRVTFDDRAAAAAELPGLVAQVSGTPGFVAGYWTAVDADTGSATIIFDSEEGAQALASVVRSTASPTVTTTSVEVGEVMAHA